MHFAQTAKSLCFHERAIRFSFAHIRCKRTAHAAQFFDRTQRFFSAVLAFAIELYHQKHRVVFLRALFFNRFATHEFPRMRLLLVHWAQYFAKRLLFHFVELFLFVRKV